MDEQTIQAKIAQARAAGIPEDMIQAKVAELRKPKTADDFVGTPPPQAPVVPTPESQVRQDLASKIGAGAISFGKSIVDPFVRTGKKIVAAGVQTPLMLIEASLRSSGQNPTADIMEKARKKLDVIGLNDEEFQQLSDDKKGAVIQQIKDSLNIASYAVPFGKGAGVIKQAILPGVTTGAMQGASQEDATIESVLGSALIGGGTAGLLHGVSKLTKLGQKVEEAGGKMRGSTRKITQKPSIYGAGQEKEINKTLDTLGITGTPQQQYEQLQPKMQELGDQIESVLSTKSKQIKVSQIADDFKKNVKSSILSGDITNKEATTAYNSYIKDLYESMGDKLGDMTDTRTLFELKKLVNESYGVVQNVIDRGGTLSPRQKIIAAFRKTLDDVIANAHPEVKNITRMQSHLYDAATSLSRARFTPPTLRGPTGFTIPQGATNTAVDLTGRATQVTGRGIQAIGGALPAITPTAEKVAAIGSAQLLNKPAQEPQSDLQTQDYSAGYQDTTSDFQHKNIVPLPPITGYSLEELGQAYSRAILDGNKSAATQIKNLYDIETNYQKSQKPKAVSSGMAKDKALASSGMRGVEEITTMLQKDPTILAKSFLTPGNLLTRKYENAAFRAAEAILRMRTGAVVNPNEAKKYAQTFLPWFGDDIETINYKLEQAKNDYQDLLMIYNAEEPGQGSSLPTITTGGE